MKTSQFGSLREVMDNQDMTTQPVVISGCRRSGTTLLNTILARHPALLVHPDEPQFFLELYKRFGEQIPDVKKAIEHVTRHPYYAKSLSQEAFFDAFQGVTTIALPTFSQQYLHLWGGVRLETRRPVFKHPALIFYLELVFYLFPKAKIIHLVRDPHANILSQRQRWKKATLWECIGWWRDAAQAGHTLAQARPETCFEITYEDLSIKAEESLSHLCAFLEIPYLESLLAFDMNKRIYAPGEARPENTADIRPKRMDAWKQQLTALEIALIEQECQPEMAWWGYESLHPKVPPTQLAARTKLEQLMFAFKTAVRRVKGTNWRG